MNSIDCRSFTFYFFTFLPFYFFTLLLFYPFTFLPFYLFPTTSLSKKSRKKGQLGPASCPPWCCR